MLLRKRYLRLKIVCAYGLFKQFFQFFCRFCVKLVVLHPSFYFFVGIDICCLGFVIKSYEKYAIVHQLCFHQTVFRYAEFLPVLDGYGHHAFRLCFYDFHIGREVRK